MLGLLLSTVLLAQAQGGGSSTSHSISACKTEGNVTKCESPTKTVTCTKQRNNKVVCETVQR